MPAKRTDKILELLDDALQSTSPSNHGMPLGDADLCMCCQRTPAIQGRSWCEACLPEKNGPVDEVDPYWVTRGSEPEPEPEDEGEWEVVEGGPIYAAVEAALAAHLAECREAGAQPAPAMIVRDETGEAIGYAINVEALVMATCTDEFHAFLARMEAAVAQAMEGDE